MNQLKEKKAIQLIKNQLNLFKYSGNRRLIRLIVAKKLNVSLVLVERIDRELGFYTNYYRRRQEYLRGRVK